MVWIALGLIGLILVNQRRKAVEEGDINGSVDTGGPCEAGFSRDAITGVCIKDSDAGGGTGDTAREMLAAPGSWNNVRAYLRKWGGFWPEGQWHYGYSVDLYDDDETYRNWIQATAVAGEYETDNDAVSLWARPDGTVKDALWTISSRWSGGSDNLTFRNDWGLKAGWSTA